jgi:hypothetical protein
MALIKAKYRGLDSAAHNEVILSTASCSSDSSVTFEFTGDYKFYKIVFHDLHTSSDVQDLRIKFSSDGTNFNVAKTQSGFKSARDEAGTVHTLAVDGTLVANNTTGGISIIENLGTDNDQTCMGEFVIANPLGTTYTKNYYSRGTVTESANYTRTDYCGGYANTSSAVTHIYFDLTGSANFDTGEFILYGIRT